ncbi:MAG: electron transfer flavoprotein subunit alpha/FixB family protein [Acidimicrobiales bacterium]|nr:electron transfer flavoprotein subunit alpha/FixB family protein [Acidimicrobiales bacterium]
MSVLVLCDHDRGALAEASLEALTFGRRLANDLGVACSGVLIGEGADNASTSLASYGADSIYLVEHSLLTDYGPSAWGESLVQLVNKVGPTAVLACGTDRGNEVIAHLAASIDAPFVANCLTADTTNPSTWLMTRVQWGGSLLEDSELSTEQVKIFTVVHHGIEAEQSESSNSGQQESFTPELDESVGQTIVADRVVLTQGITLSTSPVVVGGGRGVGSAEAFAPLEELAEELNGVVGCSRAVTNNGWRPHSDQVGQTGTRIAPQIYIANGISGAIQHWVGAMAAKNILAINIDPEANMVAKAGYAVIGDLHQVVPAVLEEIRRRKS